MKLYNVVKYVIWNQIQNKTLHSYSKTVSAKLF